MLASAFGSYDAVKLLVDGGADVKAASAAGVTALHVAWRDEAVVRLLLDHHADVNAKTQFGATPLVVAASATGTAGVVTLLLDNGADPNAAENRGVTPLIAAAGVGNTASRRAAPSTRRECERLRFRCRAEDSHAADGRRAQRRR